MINEKERMSIGILQNELQPSKGYITINNNTKNIMAKVMNLTLPEGREKLSTSYSNSFAPELEMDIGKSKGENERKEAFADKARGKLIIYSYDSVNHVVCNESAMLVPRPVNFKDDTKFYPVPVMRVRSNATDDWEFEKNRKRKYAMSLSLPCHSMENCMQLMREQKPIGTAFGFDPSIFTPAFVIWYEEGSFHAIGNILDMKITIPNSLLVSCNHVSEISIDDCCDDMVYAEDVNPTLAFLTKEAYEKIEFALLEKVSGMEVSPDETEDIISTEEALENFDVSTAGMPDLNFNTPDVAFEDRNGRGGADSMIQAVTNEIVKQRAFTDSEIIDNMIAYSKQMGLSYMESDLVNFHASVKSGNYLTILAGLSGTGKSKLAEVYAAACGRAQLLVIPVRPSWTEDEDLFGYFDIKHGIYNPSETGLVDILIEAQRHPEKQYLICLDEMNLARPERYLASVLSMLEQTPGRRFIRLYAEAGGRSVFNGWQYPSTVKIGENVKFIGTINVDDTTNPISDKVLDRCNVISLTMKNYAEEKDTELRKLLWEMNKVLQETSPELGVSRRVLNAIESYLDLISGPLSKRLPMADAVDMQIEQRVLTKVRGSGSQLVDLFPDEKDKLTALFDKYAGLSHFKRSRSTVLRKKKELMTIGYCV